MKASNTSTLRLRVSGALVRAGVSAQVGCAGSGVEIAAFFYHRVSLDEGAPHAVIHLRVGIARALLSRSGRGESLSEEVTQMVARRTCGCRAVGRVTILVDEAVRPCGWG